MGLERTPLDLATLGEPARKVLGGPAPLKLMAARGLAPLARPADFASVLYQLALDSDAAVRTAAEKTSGELPERILAGALAEPGLDARVLDFFAARIPPNGTVCETLLLNPATADVTVGELVPKLDERLIEIVAANEQRLLRAPAIIGAMYMNTRSRMSTVDRAVELAVRNKIVVPGIPSWEQVVAGVLGVISGPAAVAAGAGQSGASAAAPAATSASAAPSASASASGAASVEDPDAIFKSAAAVGIGESAESERKADELTSETATQEAVEKAKSQVNIGKLSVPAKIRLATLGNAFARSILVRDSNKQVAMAAITSPGLVDNEVIRFASNKSLSEDVIRVIANSKTWTKVYQVKVSLVNNPKTPLPIAMRLLPFMRDRDLRGLAKSKSIPSALAAQAKKLTAAKGGGG